MVKKQENAGEFPFTRGLYPKMYKEKKSTIREFAGQGSAKDTNKRFRLILNEGGTGLSTAFDLPTLMGRDSDEEICEGQVGWDGVAIDTLADMEILFHEIPIDQTTVSMTINAPAAILWAMYIAMAQKRGIPLKLLGGTLQNDILKEYTAQKEWLFPEEHGVRLVTDTIEYAAIHMPKWHPVSISGYHIREAGTTAVQEVAYTLYDGLEYVKSALARGIQLDMFAPQLSFFFDLHNNFVEEVAKLRAARRLWARLMLERFGATNPRSQWCRMHVQTAGVTLTRQEPLNNIVRITMQALIGILGGAQSIHTNSYDEVLCTPTEEAVKVAIRTQQILQEETGICQYVDPIGGAYAFEEKTNQIETEALEEIKRIDDLGGMIQAIKQGYPQSMIQRSAFEQEQKIANGEIAVISVNKFENQHYTLDEPRNIKEELKKRRGAEQIQIAQLRKIKNSRSNTEVKRALGHIKMLAESNLNVMPALIEASKVYATLGEMCQTLQSVFGEYKEDNRDFSDVMFTQDMQKIVGKYRLTKPSRILFAKGGLDGHDRLINTMLTFYKHLGAETIFPGLHCSMQEIAKRAVEEDVDIIGISTHIGNPLTYFESLRRHLKSLGSENITIIGGGIITSDASSILSDLGVKRFFPTGSSFEDIAKFLHEEGTNNGK